MDKSKEGLYFVLITTLKESEGLELSDRARENDGEDKMVRGKRPIDWVGVDQRREDKLPKRWR